LGLTACAVLAGCGTLDGASQRIAGVVKPFQIQVVQGNFVSNEQRQALRLRALDRTRRPARGDPLSGALLRVNQQHRARIDGLHLSARSEGEEAEQSEAHE
jgi:outer membrane protein assembly factor BamE